MNVEAIDLGDELREGVQLGLALGPVIIRTPVASKLLDHRDGHALRIVGNRLALGPPCREYSPAQLAELPLGKVHLKRTNRGRVAARLLPCILLSGGRAHFLCSFAWVRGDVDWAGNAARTAAPVGVRRCLRACVRDPC